MSVPSKRITPVVGVSNNSSILAVVVLPHPDSPTKLKVSPAWTRKEMPSTARTQTRAGRRDIRPRTAKCLVRLLMCSRSALATPGAFIDASSSAPYVHRPQHVLEDTRAGSAPAHRDSAAQRRTPTAGRRLRAVAPQWHITAARAH